METTTLQEQYQLPHSLLILAIRSAKRETQLHKILKYMSDLHDRGSSVAEILLTVNLKGASSFI